MNLENILTNEEKDFLDKINRKYQSHIETFYNNSANNLEEQITTSGCPEPFNEAEPSRHITNYQREILIKLTAEISTVNEQGRLTNVDLCLENFYHIPVPPETDFDIKLKEFVDIFDQDIATCAKKINNTNEGK
jgi:hypothetical protein